MLNIDRSARVKRFSKWIAFLSSLLKIVLTIGHIYYDETLIYVIELSNGLQK